MQELVIWARRNKLVVFMVVITGIITLCIGGVLFIRQKVSPSVEPAPFMSEAVMESSGPPLIYADIKGGVVQPGMYPIEPNMRVLDVVNMAGGFTAEADQKRVNFSQIVSDQMLIYVPVEGEALEWQESPGVVKGETPGQSSKVNLNTADASGLQQLSGIGEKKAAAIISYREEHGSFSSIEDIKKVSGIGDKTFESLKDDLEV